MKQIFLSVTALLFLATCVNAQNSSPYWSLAGNSNTSSSSKLGTTNSKDLKLFTNNSERMRITSSGDVGIGTTSFSAKMMINSSSSENPLKVQVNGSSKLFVSSNGGVSIGSPSTPPANGLDVAGNVGIGTTIPTAKLDVVGSKTTGNGVNVSGYSIGLQAGSTASGYGVYGYSGYCGVYGAASSGSMGVYGFSGNTGVYGVGGTYGLSGYCNDGSGTYGASYDGNGVYGNSTKSYGGYFVSTDGSALVASTTNGYYAGLFYGHVYSSAGFVTSDKNLKTNIHDFGDAMGIINKLKPQNYEFKKDAKYESLHLPKGSHYGLLAQDLQQVLPNLVSEAPHELRTIKPVTAIMPTADGKPAPIVAETKETPETINIKAVNYVELIPIMVKALQELNADKDKKIADLQNQINDLKSLILKNGNSSASTSVEGYIKQNAPNPSSNNTVISYFTPDNTKKAQILVTDMKGSVLKAYDVSRGEGQVNIRNGELPTGTYNYTLYVNSNKIDTKQMIIMK